MESAFQTVPINITGPSYQDRSRPLASQESRNVYPELVEQGKDQFVLKSFPGQKSFGSTSAALDRGQNNMDEVCYRVVANTLYEVSALGIHTSRGSIGGSERCIFANDGVNLFIVADGVVNHYDSTTNITSIVTDPDIAGALSVAFLNNQFIYTFPLLSVVSVVGDGTDATSLNGVGAESDPDKLVRDYAFDQNLYRFGKRSCETWYNSGVGTPPIDRIEGQIINVGLDAKHSVAHSKDFVYWLGSDLQVYAARGGQEQAISTASVAGAIQAYSYTSDAFGETFTIDNKVIYVLTFPLANKTWALIESLGANGWFELSEGITDGQWNVGSILEIYNKILVGDRSNGSLYELDFDTYDQAGTPWRRRRVIGTINGETLGQRGHRVQMSSMEFIMDTGNGLITGQGSDPRIMVEPSYDGGKSWDTGTWMRVGRLGETNIIVKWDSMHSFYDMTIRLTTSDPVPYNIYSAAIDLRLAGR